MDMYLGKMMRNQDAIILDTLDLQVGVNDNKFSLLFRIP